MNGEETSQLKPKLVPCKKWLLFSRKDGNIYCIGNEKTGDFVQVPEDQLEVIEAVINLFDGKHSLGEIHEHILQTMDLDVPVDQIFKVFRDANLIENFPKENPDEFQRTSTILLSKDLGQLFEKKLSKKVFYSIFFLSVLLIIVGTGTFITKVGYTIFSLEAYYLIGDSTAIGFLISFIIIYASSFIHELGHIIVAWYVGVPPREIRVLLYLGVFPMLFVNIPNIYTASRRHRILIAIAGMYTNIVLASLASLLLIAFEQNMIAYQLLVYTALFNFITPIFILNPFLPGDGYFLAVNVFKTPNIRREAFKRLRRIRETKWSKGDIALIAYGTVSILMSAYFFYWFLEWFSLALLETVATLSLLSTLADYLLLAIKIAFFSLMIYSTIKTITLTLNRKRGRSSSEF